jgi:hypothetical protein
MSLRRLLEVGPDQKPRLAGSSSMREMDVDPSDGEHFALENPIQGPLESAADPTALQTGKLDIKAIEVSLSFGTQRFKFRTCRYLCFCISPRR